jgi:hypothetical protein
MWTETYHRFVDEAAFLAACETAGWARGPDGRPTPPEGVVLDVVGPAVEPPSLSELLVLLGKVDLRWRVIVAWFSGTTLPEGFANAEVFPEQPVRMLAARAIPTQARHGAGGVKGPQSGEAKRSAPRPVASAHLGS